MKTQLQKDFNKFLQCGAYATPPGRAVCALEHARILAEWRDAEAAGLVRLRMEPEQESYFDVYGKPETQKEKDQLVATLDRLGCYYVISEVNRGGEFSDQWEFADSIGMCVYENPLDPFENCYVPDLMKSALTAIPCEGTH